MEKKKRTEIAQKMIVITFRVNAIVCQVYFLAPVVTLLQVSTIMYLQRDKLPLKCMPSGFWESVLLCRVHCYSDLISCECVCVINMEWHFAMAQRNDSSLVPLCGFLDQSL